MWFSTIEHMLSYFITYCICFFCRGYWKSYFDARGINIAFWSATEETERQADVS